MSHQHSSEGDRVNSSPQLDEVLRVFYGAFAHFRADRAKNQRLAQSINAALVDLDTELSPLLPLEPEAIVGMDYFPTTATGELILSRIGRIHQTIILHKLRNRQLEQAYSEQLMGMIGSRQLAVTARGDRVTHHFGDSYTHPAIVSGRITGDLLGISAGSGRIWLSGDADADYFQAQVLIDGAKPLEIELVP
jgi:hypothetical protein